MTTDEFLTKWEKAFFKAINPIVDAVAEAGYQVTAPYSLESSGGGPIFGFTVWKPPVQEEDDEAVDVWWWFDRIAEPGPIRYWPALDLIEKGGSQVGSTNFWDASVKLADSKMIKKILEKLGTETDWIIENLGKQEWIPEGPREWMPKPRLEGAQRPRRFLHGTSARAWGKIKKEGLVNPYLTNQLKMALHFGDIQAVDDHSHPVILEVIVRDRSRLRVDQEMWAEPLDWIKRKHHIERNQEWFEAVREGYIDTPEDDSDWPTSLRMVHSVTYDGVIPASDIRIAEGD